MLNELLVIDIETVPQVPAFADLSSNWQELWQEKVAKTMPEDVLPEESYRKRAGILAEFGKIICISTAVFSYNDMKINGLRVKSVSGDDERAVLEGFVEICNKMYGRNRNFQFAGHNIREFDIPYICRRMIINGMLLPEYLQLNDRKPWEVRMMDTLSWWKFGDYKHYTSLHLMANVLGIPTSKTDMDGSMVQDVYYKEHDLQRIVDYCQRDVVVTANIILRFQQLPMLREEDVVIVES
ncbi:MAG: hypothetical protein RIR90_935 [Bacteroidota bacterium]|jgi:predicted PolB exonuclease-like 3'-5' exonuclease